MHILIHFLNLKCTLHKPLKDSKLKINFSDFKNKYFFLISNVKSSFEHFIKTKCSQEHSKDSTKLYQ